MYVRWKRRDSQVEDDKWAYERVDGKLTARLKNKDELNYTLSAYLMQSVRINGKPRQKSIAFLGSIKSDDIRNNKMVFRLWSNVAEVVTKLELDEAAREKIYQALAEKTPRPSQEEMEKEEQRSKALLAAYGLDKPYVRDPNAPPMIGTTNQDDDTERPLYIKWSNEYRGRYSAVLVKETEINGKKKVLPIARLGRIEKDQFRRLRIFREKHIENHAWREYWFQVHKALCRALVDNDTYYQALQLVGKRVEQPSHSELLSLIQEGQKREESATRTQINDVWAKYERLREKEEELEKLRLQSEQYRILPANVEY